MQHESRLDPLACADEPQLFDAAHAVLASKLFGRDSSCVQNVRIGDELSRPGLSKSRAEDMAHLPIGDENGTLAHSSKLRARLV